MKKNWFRARPTAPASPQQPLGLNGKPVSRHPHALLHRMPDGTFCSAWCVYVVACFCGACACAGLNSPRSDPNPEVPRACSPHNACGFIVPFRQTGMKAKLPGRIRIRRCLELVGAVALVVPTTRAVSTFRCALQTGMKANRNVGVAR